MFRGTSLRQWKLWRPYLPGSPGLQFPGALNFGIQIMVIHLAAILQSLFFNYCMIIYDNIISDFSMIPGVFPGRCTWFTLHPGLTRKQLKTLATELYSNVPYQLGRGKFSGFWDGISGHFGRLWWPKLERWCLSRKCVYIHIYDYMII